METTSETVVEKIDTQEVRTKDVRAKSTAASTDLGYYYLILQRAKGQGNYGLCWAAAIATISNYKRDTYLTAKQVTNAIGIGYNDGATLSQAQDAMRKQGLYFTRRREYAPFDLVKMNIQNRSPLYISGVGYSNGTLVGHATTIYGYKEVAGEQCLMIWDSASNGNKGDSYMVSYNGASTVFFSDQNSAVYTWNGTLLEYK